MKRSATRRLYSTANASIGFIATAVILIALWAFLTPNVIGQEMSSARAVAMGSAGIALAKGVDAAWYNPANLGFCALPSFTVATVRD